MRKVSSDLHSVYQSIPHCFLTVASRKIAYHPFFHPDLVSPYKLSLSAFNTIQGASFLLLLPFIFFLFPFLPPSIFCILSSLLSSQHLSLFCHFFPSYLGFPFNFFFLFFIASLSPPFLTPLPCSASCWSHLNEMQSWSPSNFPFLFFLSFLHPQIGQSEADKRA